MSLSISSISQDRSVAPLFVASAGGLTRVAELLDRLSILVRTEGPVRHRPLLINLGIGIARRPGLEEVMGYCLNLQ